MTEVATQVAGSKPVSTRNRVREGVHGLHLPLAAAIGLTLVACLVRLYRINQESLWLDEGYTLLFTHLSLLKLFVVGGAHEHPPLYYLVVHLLLRFHDSYLVPRVVSAVAGSLCVPVLYALGTRLRGRGAGLVAAGLLAVSPFHIWYSQDARGYELAGLLVLLSYLALWIALEQPRRVLWLAYAASTALALYSEYTTIFVLLPQAILYLRARRQTLGTALLLSWLGVGIAFLPWMGTLLLDAASISGQYWIPAPTTTSIVHTVLEFLGLLTPCPSPPCTGVELGFGPLLGREAPLAVLVCAAVVLSLAYAVWTRDLDLTVLASWLIVPFVLVLLVAVRRSLYLDRIFLDATFAFYLLIGASAAGVSHASPLRVVVIGLSVLMALASMANLPPVFAGGINPDWRSAVHDFRAAYRPGQAVVFHPGVIRNLVSAYLPRGWRATRERPMWYRSYLDVPGWEQRYGSLTDAELRDRQLTEASRGERQIWLVSQDYTALNDTRHWFVVHGYQPVLSQIYAGDTRIELWDRLPPHAFGLPVLRDFPGPSWARTGAVAISDGVAREMGAATLSRSFPITAGVAYTVSLEYLGLPPAGPTVSLQTYDRQGRPVGGFIDRLGQRLDSFPRTEWFNLPVNGVWLSQPFGFIAPSGAVTATLRLGNRWGWSYWRNIDVYRER